jgi:hypothetical protein
VCQGEQVLCGKCSGMGTLGKRKEETKVDTVQLERDYAAWIRTSEIKAWPTVRHRTRDVTRHDATRHATHTHSTTRVSHNGFVPRMHRALPPACCRREAGGRLSSGRTRPSSHSPSPGSRSTSAAASTRSTSPIKVPPCNHHDPRASLNCVAGRVCGGIRRPQKLLLLLGPSGGDID